MAGFDISGDYLSRLKETYPEQWRFYRCDVTDAAQAKASVDSLVRERGATDLLVNKAGLATYRRVKPWREPGSYRMIAGVRRRIMAETVRQIEYFYILVPNKAGEAVRILRTLKDAGVNLVAFSGFPQARRSQLDFIPADASAFKNVAAENDWKLVGPKRGFLIQGDDRVGAVADIVGALADANINITAIDAVCANGRYGALCWVAPGDMEKAAQVLKAQ